ncbi:MAG: YraN family protein [Pseudomonadota bacterium]
MSKPRPNVRKNARRAAERKGRIAEWVAAMRYALGGTRILARRFRAYGGEADIIAFKNDVLIIVEVKRRATIDAAIEAVTPSARRRIERAGAAFRASRPAYAECGVRYDIAALAPRRLVLVKDAWRDGE